MGRQGTPLEVAYTFDVDQHPGYQEMVRQVLGAARSKAKHPRYELLAGMAWVCLIIYLDLFYRALIAVKSWL